MTLPKKDTRTIKINGESYLWHRSSRFETQNRWTVIRKVGTDGQLLLLDPYHHDLSLGAGAVRKAIEFAHSRGWTPEIKAAPMKLRFNGDTFDGEQFTVLPLAASLSDR